METTSDHYIWREKIVRCSDDSGKLILTEVKDGPLLQVMIMIMISMMQDQHDHHDHDHDHVNHDGGNRHICDDDHFEGLAIITSDSTQYSGL